MIYIEFSIEPRSNGPLHGRYAQSIVKVLVNTTDELSAITAAKRHLGDAGWEVVEFLDGPADGHAEGEDRPDDPHNNDRRRWYDVAERHGVSCVILAIPIERDNGACDL